VRANVRASDSGGVPKAKTRGVLGVNIHRNKIAKIITEYPEK